MMAGLKKNPPNHGIPVIDVLRKIVRYPLPREYRKHAGRFLKNPKMEEAYRLIRKWAKGKDVVPVFAEAFYIGLLCNPGRGRVPPPLSDTKLLKRMRDASEMILERVPVIGRSISSRHYQKNLWFHAAADCALKKKEAYPVDEITDDRVLDALRVVRDFLHSYLPEPRRRGRPVATDQNYLMMRLADLFKKQFRRPLHAVIALYLETVCGGGWTEEEVKTSLPRLRKANR